MEKKKNMGNPIKSQAKKRYAILLSITAAFIVLYIFTLKNFVSLESITNLIRSSSVMTILACGMTVVILTGGVDLSVGANIAISGMVAATVMNAAGGTTFGSAVLGFLACLAVSVTWGVMNGFLIGFLHIPPFIATMATQYLANGITMYATNGISVMVNNPYFNLLGGKVFSVGPLRIPYMAIPLVILILLTFVLLNRTSFGRKTYIVGGNAVAGKAVGIHVPMQILLAYAYTGFMAAFATVITIGRASSAQPTAGTNLEFNVITAVVLGGITLSGGAGTLVGSLLGCLLMGIMTMGMNMINIPVYFNNILKGAFILAAVLADGISNSIASKNAIRMGAKASEDISGHEEAAGQAEASELGDFRVFSFRHVNKYFPGVQALDNVSFDIKAGTVHALAGENGAGKSTLIKILSGVYPMDSGELLVDGKPLHIHGPQDSRNKGISTIFQELTLVPELSVSQNVFLGKERTDRLHVCVDARAMAKRTKEIMDRFEMDIQPGDRVGSLSVSKQQMVEIARSFDSNARIVIMDEPTSAISEADKEVLFSLIRELKSHGIAVIYISHRIQELFEIADEVTILRDGRHIVTMPIGELDNDSIVRYMVNRDLGDIFHRERAQIREEVLSVKDLCWQNKFRHISFNVHAGEVVGFVGLVGAGRTEVARCICGLEKPTSGQVFLYGKPIQIHSVKQALDEGICYVSEDRRREGIIPLLSVRDNITASSIGNYSKMGFLDTAAEVATAQKFIDQFSIKTPSDLQPIGNLSGGNQQKCCLARVFACSPKLIIFDEPTRGIDVGAKAEIHKLIENLAKSGIACIIISSELPEVLGVSDRIVVMAEGSLTAILENDGSVSQEKIMLYATDFGNTA